MMKKTVFIFLLSLFNVMAWGVCNDGTPQPEKDVTGEGLFTPNNQASDDVIIYYKKNVDGNTASVYWVDRGAQDVQSVVIPSTVINNGTTYNVTAIDEEAFRTYYLNPEEKDIYGDITSIVLPSSIASIGNNAFDGLTLDGGIVIRSTKVPTVDTSLGELKTGYKIKISVPIELMYQYEQPNSVWNTDAIIYNALVKMNDGSPWISVCSYKPLVCSESESFAAFKALRMNNPGSDELEDIDEPDNSVMLKLVSYIPEGQGVWIHRGKFNGSASGFAESTAQELSIPIYIADYPKYSSVTPAPMNDNLFVGSWKSPTAEHIVTLNSKSGYTDYALSKNDDKAHSTANLAEGTTLGFCKAILRMPTPQGVKATTLTMYVADDDATTIAPAFKYDTNSENIYSISGTPLPKNSKGLQIVNGKKILKSGN